MTEPKEGDLRVWWIPQVPGTPFHVPIKSTAIGLWLCEVLADYDFFQFENNIKPDYSNVGGVQIYEGGEWCDLVINQWR